MLRANITYNWPITKPQNGSVSTVGSSQKKIHFWGEYAVRVTLYFLIVCATIGNLAYKLPFFYPFFFLSSF